ncbi:hypothetical protein TIFTF001_018143 [Ficus carica]|uniref:Uncharacterized protein n=1 Tax=Ficus carica TaxID=3494 RepID=A0AA88AAK0_FICCA|nr:hypothetical protein TIFTF001_018143 [Ficus carica]
MGRAPCCEKMGLKKGPWSPEEDQMLISYIQKHGHGNWRALPKQAGLLRCGKSCRLRWINYLRPDIKRGNFSREEEETIIQLHEMLGNRWSAITARLPGRTDNEIKNVWHTHLKKRLKQSNHDVVQETKRQCSPKHEEAKLHMSTLKYDNMDHRPSSPTQSSSISDFSSVTSNRHHNNNDNKNNNTSMKSDPSENFSELDESFWSEVLSAESCSEVVDDFSAISKPLLQFPFSPLVTPSEPVHAFGCNIMHDEYDLDFWHNSFTKAGDLQELLAEIK